MVRHRIANPFHAGSSPVTHSKGELAERSKAAVLKTVDVKASGGSNPSLSATVEVGVGTQGVLIRLSAPD